jgi:hypothetical protein
VGGPAPGTPRPLSGVVKLTSATGKHISIATNKNGSIKAHVAVGTYMVIGRSPKIEGDVWCSSPVLLVARTLTVAISL